MRAPPLGRAALTVATMAAAAVALVAAPSPTAGIEKTVIVTVTDRRTGAPVTGLAAAAFAIREDNLDREVVRVSPATEPLDVVLLADTTTAFLRYSRDLRVAAQTFAQALLAASPASSLAVWEFGGADIPVVDFTSDLAVLEAGTAKLFPKGSLSNIPESERLPSTFTSAATGARPPVTSYTGGQNVVGSNLLEAIVGASRQLARRPGRRRVIVSFNSDLSVEASSLQGPMVQDEVRKAGTTWFGVSLTEQVSNGPLRDNVMNVLCPLSGGERRTIVDIAALAPALRRIADVLTSQYLVTYMRPAGEPTQVIVGIRREGLRAATFRWAPG